MKLYYRAICALFLTLLFTCNLVKGQDGAALYKKYCGSCHTLGGGKLVGPDLAGITSKRNQDWLRKFILNSADLIKAGDPDALAIAKTYNNMIMPPFPGTAAELSSIISYLASSAGSLAQGSVADTFLMQAGEEHASRGKDLFTGAVRFMNGGPSCIACHATNNINGIGGLLAKSLNLSFFTLQGPGIRSMMQAPTFPAMVNAYGTHPLTETEVYDVAAFLKFNSKKVLAQQIPDTSSHFYLFGMAGCIGGIFLLFLLWRLRKKTVSIRTSFHDN